MTNRQLAIPSQTSKLTTDQKNLITAHNQTLNGVRIGKLKSHKKPLGGLFSSTTEQKDLFS